jgi:hypothetical protein
MNLGCDPAGTEIKVGFGKTLILNKDGVYIGDGENPKDNPYFQAWEKALKEVYGNKDKEGK